MVNCCSSTFSSRSLPGVFPFDESSFQPLAARQGHHPPAGLLAVHEIARVHPAVSSASDSPFILAQDQAKTIMQDPGELLDTGGKKEEKK
jgi:hypothetical protein